MAQERLLQGSGGLTGLFGHRLLNSWIFNYHRWLTRFLFIDLGALGYDQFALLESGDRLLTLILDTALLH